MKFDPTKVAPSIQIAKLCTTSGRAPTYLMADREMEGFGSKGSEYWDNCKEMIQMWGPSFFGMDHNDLPEPMEDPDKPKKWFPSAKTIWHMTIMVIATGVVLYVVITEASKFNTVKN